tara:strand:+ start:736 stop:1008 length:273 start_codon:yes stop_codon:yes gene_type:complete
MKFIVAYQIIQDCYIEIEAPNHIEAEMKFKSYPKDAEGPITIAGIYPDYNRKMGVLDPTNPSDKKIIDGMLKAKREQMESKDLYTARITK